MKKVFLGIGILILFLLGALIAVPFLFKDELKALLDRQIANKVDARVLYQPEKVDVSIFRSFPNLTLSIEDLTVIGKDSFARDTLAHLPNIGFNLDIMSVISGDQIKVKSIDLERPRIKLVVLKSGKANWDISKDTTQAAKDTSSLRLALEGWAVTKGTLTYIDQTLPMTVVLQDFDHKGKGDFEQNVFDLESTTQSPHFSMIYGGAKYIDNARLEADVTLGMDLDKQVYTFKENNVRLNDFAMGFDGTVALAPAPSEDVLLNLTFKAKETDFKNLLSVVPGMFTEDFGKIKTSGKIAFNGFLKGTSNATSTPGYGVDMTVRDAMFQYPDLPQAARNINTELSVRNPDGQDQSLEVNVKRIHTDFGKNPIDGKVYLKGLDPMYLDGNVKANLDLAEMTKVMKLNDLVLRGLLAVDATAKGNYSKTQMPVTQAALNLTNGYVKSKDFPAPIENLNVQGTVANATGQMNDTKVNIEQFRMLLDGEPLEGRVYATNLEHAQFDANIKGILDLTKLTKIFPQEGMTLAGRINADIATKGNMADIEAGRYTNVKSSGTMGISNFTFRSTDLPQGLAIDKSAMRFNNEQIVVENMAGKLGKSDFAASGTLSNYMGYLFAENQPLKGNLTVSSNRFDVNEWMVEEPATTPAVQVNNPDAGTVKPDAEGVVPVPDYLDMVLNMSAKQVLYENLTLDNVVGTVVVREEVARLQNVTFNTLGGSFSTSGSYNTKDLAHPKFDMGLKITGLEFKKAFDAFNTIKTIAPIAKLLEGSFSTNFNFAGELGQDMMPIMTSLTGQGVIDVIKAAVRNVKVLDRIHSLTKIDELKELVVENKRLDAQISNGFLLIKPFDVNIGDKIKMTVGGKNSPTGLIDYVAALDVPTGKVGGALTQQVQGIKGLSNFSAAERVMLNFNIGGTLSDPKVSLAGGSLKGQAKDMIKDVVKDKVDDAKLRLEQEKAAAEQRAREELEKRKNEAEQKAREEADKRKKEAEDRARQELEKQKKDAEDKLKKEGAGKLKDVFKRP